MRRSSSERLRRGSERTTLGITTCPACAGPLKPDSKWCPTCEFTGGDTLQMFSDSPPPLLPILDAAGIFDAADVRMIEAARDALHQRFPQFHWRICTVGLPLETSLPAFGFWLLNACPLLEHETAVERSWTVLLLLNADSGQVAAIPGYAAEPFLADTEWKSILATMAAPWQVGKPGEAVVNFFKSTRSHLDRAWNRYGARRSARNPS